MGREEVLFNLAFSHTELRQGGTCESWVAHWLELHSYQERCTGHILTQWRLLNL